MQPHPSLLLPTAAVCYTFRVEYLEQTQCDLWSLKYLESGPLQKIDNLCPRRFISLLALTQVSSKPESKLLGEIRLLFILGMFYLGTLIWVLMKLWKLSWAQSTLTCTLAELLEIILIMTFYRASIYLLPRADLSNWKI